MHRLPSKITINGGDIYADIGGITVIFANAGVGRLAFAEAWVRLNTGSFFFPLDCLLPAGCSRFCARFPPPPIIVTDQKELAAQGAAKGNKYRVLGI